MTDRRNTNLANSTKCTSKEIIMETSESQSNRSKAFFLWSIVYCTLIGGCIIGYLNLVWFGVHNYKLTHSDQGVLILNCKEYLNPNDWIVSSVNSNSLAATVKSSKELGRVVVIRDEDQIQVGDTVTVSWVVCHENSLKHNLVLQSTDFYTAKLKNRATGSP